MRYIELGKTGEKIPILGQGTWKLESGREKEYYDQWKKALKKGIELDLTLIDTAEIYGDGKSEEVVGEVIKETEEDLFIASKVWSSNLRYNDVIKAATHSLKRLGIKQIDLYQIHWPNHSIPLKGTMEAMEYLVQQGKIRYIGVSNFSADLVTEARSYLKKEEIASNQVEYSVIKREPEKKVLPQCIKEGITLMAYSPLASNGLRNIPNKLNKKLISIADKYKASIQQVALNWLISKRNVMTIPKAMTIKHVIDNAKSVDLKIENDDLLTI
ncbi:MAG: aldo/keto reductase [Candidatus Helarchaeota archaeon]|nr:aldo/keto reductase [Candidatus Helarchaeota archaeon]